MTSNYLLRFFTGLSCILLLVLQTSVALADQANPRIIRSARNGNFATASTWVGNLVPTAYDFVIIDHAVTLNQSFTVGGAGTGGLVVNNGASLTGTGFTVTLQGGASYTFTNNGTLNIGGVAFAGTGASFVNNADATLAGSQTWANGGQIVNRAYMTVNGSISHQGLALLNDAVSGTLTVNGRVTVNNGSILENKGTLIITSTDNQALALNSGATLYNRQSGRLRLLSGGLYQQNGVLFANDNQTVVKNYLNEGGTLLNGDTLVVSGQLTNNDATISNARGAYLQVGSSSSAGSFINQYGSNSVVTNNGRLAVWGTLTNQYAGALLTGAGTGGLAVTGTLVNSGTIANMDVCVNGTTPVIGGTTSNLTYCQFQAPTASLLPTRLTGPALLCPNGTGTYTVAAVAGASSYTWTVPAGYTITDPGSGTLSNGGRTLTATAATSITVQAGPSPTTGLLTAQVNGNGNTYNTLSVTLRASAAAPATPSAILAPPGGVPCLGRQGYVLSVVPTAGTGYTWTVPADWIINYGQGTSSISVTLGSASGNVSVTADNGCGSSSASTLALAAPPSTVAAPTLSTSTTAACTGGTYTYTVVPVNGVVDYNWTISTSPANAYTISTPANSLGYRGNTITVTFNQAGTFALRVAGVTDCGTGATRTLNGQVNQAAPALSLTAATGTTNNATPCANTPGAVYAVTPVSNITGYSWSLPTGWVITTPSGLQPDASGRYVTASTVASITVTPSDQAGQVAVAAVSACGPGTDATLSVTPAAAPTQAPTAITRSQTTYCPNTQLTLSSTLPAGTTPVWAVPATWVIDSVVTVGTATTLYTTPGNNAANGAVTLRARNAGGCLSPSTATGTVSATSGRPSFATTTATTNPGAVVAGQTYTYTVGNTSSTTYAWTVPADWTITAPSGATNNGTQLTTTSSSITVMAGGASGNVTVTGTRSGCQSLPATRAVAADTPAASAPGLYDAGKKTSCYALNDVLYTLSDVNSGVRTATVTQGSLPSGVALAIVSNQARLTVADPGVLARGTSSTNGPASTGGPSTALVTSTTSFTLTTTDVLGGVTEVPLTLSFNSDQLATVATSPAKTLQNYANGDILATYADPDGAITSTALASGSLPYGTALRTQNGQGQLYVANVAQLTPGTYSFTTTCTDAGCTIGLSRTPTTVSIGNNQALPVELTAFGAQRAGRSVQLRWTTAQERANAYFAVERSLDGGAFRELARVAGQGTTTSAHQYAFTDAAAPAARCYYRLRQVDTDGTEHLSAVRAVAPATDAPARLEALAYPNPTAGRLTLALPGTAAPQLTVSLSSALGKALRTQQLPLNAAGEVSLDLRDLPAGLYLLRLQADGLQTVLRITKE